MQRGVGAALVARERHGVLGEKREAVDVPVRRVAALVVVEARADRYPVNVVHRLVRGPVTHQPDVEARAGVDVVRHLTVVIGAGRPDVLDGQLVRGAGDVQIRQQHGSLVHPRQHALHRAGACHGDRACRSVHRQEHLDGQVIDGAAAYLRRHRQLDLKIELLVGAHVQRLPHLYASDNEAQIHLLIG